MTELCYTADMEKNLRTIYKMLRAFESALDDDEFNPESISPESLDITENRRNRYLEMLVDKGYVSGVKITKLAGAGYKITLSNPAITIDGIEFMAENAAMQRAYRALKGIKDIIN